MNEADRKLPKEIHILCVHIHLYLEKTELKIIFS